MTSHPKPRIQLIMAASKALDRRGAAAIIREDLAVGALTGNEWRDVADYPVHVGEYGVES